MWKKARDKEESPRTVNYLWVLAGGYLIYLGGSLIYDVFTGNTSSVVLAGVAGIVFVGVGGAVCLREWRIYRYGSKEEQEAWAEEQQKIANMSEGTAEEISDEEES